MEPLPPSGTLSGRCLLLEPGRFVNRRALIHGVLAGTLLSAMRAPRGLDWTHLGAVDASTAALFRAAALLAVAISLDASRPAFRQRFSVWAYVLAAAVGFAGHGLLVATRWEPSGRLGFAIVLVLATAVLWWVAGSSRPPQEGEPEPDRLPLAERLGIGVAASGAAISLENLAHHARLLGLGLPEDDTVIGTVFLVALGVGALAFGGLLRKPTWRRVVLATGLAFASAATLFGLDFAGRMQAGPLFTYLDRFGLDFSVIGSWRTTSLLAGAILVVPCFVAGAALSTARHAGRLSCVALGGAAGLFLTPWVVESVGRPYPAAELGRAPWAFEVLVLGTTIASLGALVVVLRERGALRIAGTALSVVALLLPWSRPWLVVWSFSPWAVAPIVPELVVPIAEGVVTVEREPDGTPVVTLDRRRVSPTAVEELVDARRIAYATSLVDRSGLEEDGPRVLFVGQMTIPRARVLQGLGPIRVDRTAPWFAALPAVEGVLFPAGFSPPGELVSPAEARRRLGDGLYDLVLVMPTHGPVLSRKSAAELPWGTVAEPVLGALDVPAGTLGVAWLDAASPLVRCDLGERVLLAMDRFQGLSVGVLRGDLRPADPDGEGLQRPALLPGGTPERRIGAWELLETPSRDRARGMRAALCERLARAAAGTPREELARGLAVHYGAQESSSPYETLAQRTEVREDELRAFLAAADTMDPFSRSAWEGLAWLLTEKRMPDMVLAYVEAVAERYAPWPVLDRAVARAYMEFLEPEEARRFVERGLATAPNDPDLLVLAAELAAGRGEHADAAELYRRALAAAPEKSDVERSLGIELMRAGDPEGREIIDRLLAQDPDDPVILEALQAGPDPGEGSGSGN